MVRAILRIIATASSAVMGPLRLMNCSRVMFFGGGASWPSAAITSVWAGPETYSMMM